MDVLCIHPSFPGQFVRLAQALSKMPGVSVTGAGDAGKMAENTQLEGIPLITYHPPQEPSDAVHRYAKTFEAAVRRGQTITQVLLEHKRRGFEPDIILVHTGWGDGFYLRDIFPGARIIGLFEYYYRPRGADVGFDPEFPAAFDDLFRVRAMNAVPLLALESCDVGYCPTKWQRSCFPEGHRNRLQVLHDGIDTTQVAPDPSATLTLQDGTVLSAGDEVLTFVNRNLEPYRGYHIFMRALPRIMQARPDCHVVIVGGDGVSYGIKLPPGQSYRQRYLDEVADRIDHSRLHFTGSLPYQEYLKVLQVSRAHCYLSYPFVLSWSMMEAMSAGCLVIGSATPPVQEILKDGENGLLFPFRDYHALAELAIDALARPARYQQLRHAARRHIVTEYDFNTVSLPRFLQLMCSNP